MTREQMIHECRKKLPYPVSFYDSKKDSVIWSIYYKHIVCGIPIDKKHRKAKASNDQARRAEKQVSTQTSQYQQMSIFDMPTSKEKQDDKPLSMAEFATLCLNRGEINEITLHIFGESVCREIVDNGLTVEDYYEAVYGDHEPTIFYNENDGCYYRKGDAGEYLLISDEEMQWINMQEQTIGVIELREQPPKQIVLQRRFEG